MTTYFELSHGTVIETDSPENWETDPNATRLTRKEGKARVAAQCAAELRKFLKIDEWIATLARRECDLPAVYTVLRHVSRSGMRRRIDLYAVVDNKPVYLTGYAAGLMGERVHKDGGIVMNGCGMDMGFELVYRLSKALWPDDGAASGYNLIHRWL